MNGFAVEGGRGQSPLSRRNHVGLRTESGLSDPAAKISSDAQVWRNVWNVTRGGTGRLVDAVLIDERQSIRYTRFAVRLGGCAQSVRSILYRWCLR
jgi:hypothetical protein